MTFTTTDGATVTGYAKAFELAVDTACDAGFVIVGASSQSSSTYLARPGSDRRLRIADHSNGRHGASEDGDVQARLSSARVEIVTTIDFEGDDGETVIEEATEWMEAVEQSPAEIVTIVRAAMAEYDA